MEGSTLIPAGQYGIKWKGEPLHQVGPFPSAPVVSRVGVHLPVLEPCFWISSMTGLMEKQNGFRGRFESIWMEI